jgi:hypothetical protein
MLKFMSVKGLKVPKQVKVPDDWQISVQFHMTFLFDDKKKKLFFGRSARSSKMPMKHGAGNSYSCE